MKISYHMHSTGSDGALGPEQVILEAIESGITHMCFTDHYNTPDNLDKASINFYPESHYQEILKLKEKYKDKMDISIGVELDWIKGYSTWCEKEAKKRKYDHVIGSVHGLLINKGEFIGIWSHEKLQRMIDALGGKKEFVKEYYGQMRDMIKSGFFDTVGHLDVIKFRNQDDWLFSEEDDWYRKEVLKTLDVLKDSKMCLEINTKGIIVNGEEKQYPSEWIVLAAKKRNIPITIGTDFHRTKDNIHLDKAYELARRVGYKSIFIFKNRKPVEMKL
ncbi:MAG: histidinol-phosphatase [archaeon]